MNGNRPPIGWVTIACCIAFLCGTHAKPVWEVVPQKKDADRDSAATASLLEKPDCYVVRLDLPGRDLGKVEVRLDGKVLRVLAPEEGVEGRYEQEIPLQEASAEGNLQIERRPKQNLLLVTIPKDSADESQNSTADSDDMSGDSIPFDIRDVFGEMERMQREMERFMGEGLPDFSNIRPSLDRQTLDPSMDLQEEKDSYVVRARLPKAQMGNVNVSVKDQMLTIEAKEQNSQHRKEDGCFLTQHSQFSRIMRLPGPVQVGKMKVDRKDNMLVVTIPKASW